MKNDSTTKEQLLISVNERLSKLFPHKSDITKAMVFFTEYGGWYKEKVCDIRFSTPRNYLRIHRIASTYENAAQDALKIIENILTQPEEPVSLEMN